MMKLRVELSTSWKKGHPISSVHHFRLNNPASEGTTNESSFSEKTRWLGFLKEHTMICWVLFGFNFTGGLQILQHLSFYLATSWVAWRKGFLPELVCGSYISFGGHAIFVGVGLSGNQSFSPRICDSQAILPLDLYRLMTWPPFGTFCNESSPQFHRMEFFVRNCDAILFTKSS